MISNIEPTPGLVLMVKEDEPHFLRLTSFNNCAYVMRVGEPEAARYARRPFRMPWIAINRLLEERKAEWVGCNYLRRLSGTTRKATEPREIELAWALIEPLIENFEVQKNLSRGAFKGLIVHRATTQQVTFFTVYRLVLRYYYFGGARSALLPLPRGPAPGQTTGVVEEPSSSTLACTRSPGGGGANRSLLRRSEGMNTS